MSLDKKDFKAVLGFLPLLDASQLHKVQKILDKIEPTLGISLINQSDNTAYAQLFYNCLKVSIEKKLRCSCPEYEIFRRRQPKLHRIYIRKYSKTHEDALRWTNGALDRVRYQKLYFLCCRLILSDIQSWGNVPISMQTAIYRMDKIPGLIEKSFPGYIESGMLDLFLIGPKKKSFVKKSSV